MDFLYRAVYRNTDPSQAINKMQPDCLKLVAIVRKCKFKISATKASNFVNKDDENAFNTAFIHAKIGDSERLHRGGNPPRP